MESLAPANLDSKTTLKMLHFNAPSKEIKSKNNQIIFQIANCSMNHNQALNLTHFHTLELSCRSTDCQMYTEHGVDIGCKTWWWAKWQRRKQKSPASFWSKGSETSWLCSFWNITHIVVCLSPADRFNSKARIYNLKNKGPKSSKHVSLTPKHSWS